ncbi:hypothetical protein [Roseimaritima sediminicola]|uniref:hypothetical protein n=1 Tax=Roseimaritima sediminicola TaxID=2662066 RepID=UPI00129844C7|nr:hypothetical protein [Roseimaritima sediminicola]
MFRILNALLLIALVLIVAVLAITAVPALGDGHLGGQMLMAHMAVSGALVLLLPVFAVWSLVRYLDPGRSTRLARWGFWTVVLTGVATIGTVFVCMLPVLGTDAMHAMIHWHGLAGWTMLPATALLVLGSFKKRGAARS